MIHNSIAMDIVYVSYLAMSHRCTSIYVLGSEKIRLMERKMIGSDYSPAKTLQNEFCLIKIGQSSQKI